MNKRILKSSTAFLSVAFAWTLFFCSVGLAETGNAYFGNLPLICKNFAQEMSTLHEQYKKATDKQEKDDLKAQRRAKGDEFKKVVDKYLQAAPLKGKKLPFKIVGELPFEVQNVEIGEASASSVKFSIKTKLTQDIKNEKGELEQRMNVYFVAIDTAGKVIPDTANWACDHGWIKLAAGTIYDAEGHWNSVQVQNMADFDHIRIMPKADYEKLD